MASNDAEASMSPALIASTPSGVALTPTIGSFRPVSRMASSAPSAMKSLAARTPSMRGSAASSSVHSRHTPPSRRK